MSTRTRFSKIESEELLERGLRRCRGKDCEGKDPKRLGDFPRSKREPGGRVYYCYPCMRKRNQESRERVKNGTARCRELRSLSKEDRATHDSLFGSEADWA